MTDKEMNKLADLIVDKLLTTYIREQATWYTTSSMDDIFNTFKQKPRKRTKRIPNPIFSPVFDFCELSIKFLCFKLFANSCFLKLNFKVK